MSTQTRKPRTQRRAEIVKAALRIIGERGLTSFTTAAVAEEVGVTTGALFRHFDSLDAVLQGAVDHAIERIDATFPDAGLPPRERVLELARGRIELFGADPGLSWLLRSDQAYLVLPGESVAGLRAVVRRSKRFLLKAIREGAEAGDFRGDIEPKILLVPVMGTIHALAGMPGIHRKSARRPDTGRVLGALLKMLAPPGSEFDTKGE